MFVRDGLHSEFKSTNELKRGEDFWLDETDVDVLHMNTDRTPNFADTTLCLVDLCRLLSIKAHFAIEEADTGAVAFVERLIAQNAESPSPLSWQHVAFVSCDADWLLEAPSNVLVIPHTHVGSRKMWLANADVLKRLEAKICLLASDLGTSISLHRLHCSSSILGP